MRNAMFLLLLAVLGATPRLQEQKPVYVSYVDRPILASPDGQWELTVRGPQESLLAWLVLTSKQIPDDSFQKWPLRAGAWVLWRGDSKVFALTDGQYADRTYLLVFSTGFSMDGPLMGSPITNLSPVVEEAFRRLADHTYAPNKYDIALFYPIRLCAG